MAKLPKPSSWKTVIARLGCTRKGKQFLALLANGCHSMCEYDEAEGGIVNHCNGCQLQIVQLAYEMFVEGEETDGIAKATARKVLGAKS